ncbi:hypothetical protein TNCT_432731 [Trichonephila clavata]|uniref:Uncharacterized protein n=1 Tax=Trichonephila clavata TaxID=2740835 RepID=A0A8X6LY11_TRICU|nr:hypothetical protein TNCT_432731 [Trichonephila clavata]
MSRITGSFKQGNSGKHEHAARLQPLVHYHDYLVLDMNIIGMPFFSKPFQNRFKNFYALDIKLMGLSPPIGMEESLDLLTGINASADMIPKQISQLGAINPLIILLVFVMVDIIS